VNEEPIECLLVRIVVPSTCKIADVPHPAKVGCPRLRCIHHCVIYTNWKEHELPTPVLPLACRLNLPFDALLTDASESTSNSLSCNRIESSIRS